MDEDEPIIPPTKQNVRPRKDKDKDPYPHDNIPLSFGTGSTIADALKRYQEQGYTLHIQNFRKYVEAAVILGKLAVVEEASGRKAAIYKYSENGGKLA